MENLKRGQLSFVIPYYNEEKFLVETLRSLVEQKHTIDCLILVDNNSTDSSTLLAKNFLYNHPEVNAKFLFEKRPGKVNALELAIRNLDTEFVCFGDADTIYPSHYTEKIVQLFQELPSKYVALMALPVFEEMGESEKQKFIQERMASWRAHPSKCFTGGFGQSFKTKDLKLAGGFSYEQWPYCLMDHEIMNRVHKNGESYYHEDLWCMPSSRREGKREAVRWNLLERVVYRYAPREMNDWVFYKFLWGSFARRKLYSINLRDQNWENNLEKESALSLTS